MSSSTKQDNDIGWNFPPTGGGVQDGLNNPGAAHFKGNRLHHLAREILQNSLDARDNPNAPVSVVFELVELDRKAVRGISELVEHINICISECASSKQTEFESELVRAKEIFEQEKIPFLKIYDKNTTGLIDENWNALVKGSGTSIKNDDVAGGSHGIGKNAVFVISPARTVYYWTAFKSSSRHGQQLTEKFQGKAVLMHHTFENEDRQGVGFWGKRENCTELSAQEVPKQFRVVDRQQQPIQGTAIWIAGFKGEIDWQNQIASLVINNFFHAINEQFLDVTLEPESSSDEFSRGDELFEINSSTLNDWLDKLDLYYFSDYFGSQLENSNPSTIKNIQIYLNFLNDQSSAIELEDEDLGKCKLWVEFGENYSRDVALVRNTGMLITANQKGLTKIRSGISYVALCLFESASGNKLLRQMENPQHDQFMPDFLPENEREKGQKALIRITDKIRKEIRNLAKRKKEGSSDQLSELSKYLPLHLSDGPLDLADEGEKSFGEYGPINLKPIKTKNYPSLELESGAEDNADDTGSSSTQGSGEGNGEIKNGSAGTSSENGTDQVWKNIKISDVRVLPVRNKQGTYRLSFIPDETAEIKLHIQIAGDQGAENRHFVNLNDSFEIVDETKTYSVEKGSRVTTQFSDTKSIQNCAWVVKATQVIHNSD